jgi:chorismate mutase
VILAILTLIIALAISAVAAYYSIIGLIAIFSAAVIPIAVMGVVLESGKLVTAAWVYHNWKKTPKLLKGYLISAVVILMFITSMGIFGFLSKAHIEQTTVNSDNTLQIELIESQIQRERGSIERAENTLAQLDNALEKYVELGAVTKGLNARKEQETERNELNATINESTQTISSLTQKMSELNSERIAIEAEVGPIKYIAELIYGESTTGVLEDAVRGVILIIVFVFDPLAVLLLVAANQSLLHEQRKRRQRRSARRTRQKKKETAWEKKVKETKENQGVLTKVTRTADNGTQMEYYE